MSSPRHFAGSTPMFGAFGSWLRRTCSVLALWVGPPLMVITIGAWTICVPGWRSCATRRSARQSLPMRVVLTRLPMLLRSLSDRRFWSTIAHAARNAAPRVRFETYRGPTARVDRLHGSGSPEPLAGLVFTQRSGLSLGGKLLLGIEAAAPQSRRPAFLDLGSTELAAPHGYVGVDEGLSLFDGGFGAGKRGREHGGGKTDDDGLSVCHDAVPVVGDVQLLAVPAQVTRVPIAMSDHPLRQRPQEPLPGGLGGVVEPAGAVECIEVEVTIVRPRPQARLSMVPRGPGR